MSKTSVMLTKGWPGEFRRTVRDENGDAVKDDAGNDKVLLFQPGHVVELDAQALEAVRDDIGKSLYVAKLEKDSKPVPKPDREATQKIVEQNRKAAAERQKQAVEETRAAAAPAEDAPRARKADAEKKGK